MGIYLLVFYKKNLVMIILLKRDFMYLLDLKKKLFSKLKKGKLFYESFSIHIYIIIAD